jgi:hypothetical protein
MSPLKLRLKPKELERVRYLLGIEEPRVIRRANILNCLHLGYVSSDIAAILNVDPKTVTNVGTRTRKTDSTARYSMMRDRVGRSISMIGSVRGLWRWCVRHRRRAFIAGRWI